MLLGIGNIWSLDRFKPIVISSWPEKVHTLQAHMVGLTLSMLIQCWINVEVGLSTLIQHWINIDNVTPTMCACRVWTFSGQDEITIGLNPSKDHILAIPKSIYKKGYFMLKYAYLATKSWKFSVLLPKGDLFYLKIVYICQHFYCN